MDLQLLYRYNLIRQFKNKISKKKSFFKKKPLPAASDYFDLEYIHWAEKAVLKNKKIFEQEKQEILNKHIFENV